MQSSISGFSGIPLPTSYDPKTISQGTTLDRSLSEPSLVPESYFLSSLIQQTETPSDSSISAQQIANLSRKVTPCFERYRGCIRYTAMPTFQPSQQDNLSSSEVTIICDNIYQSVNTMTQEVTSDLSYWNRVMHQVLVRAGQAVDRSREQLIHSQKQVGALHIQLGRLHESNIELIESNQFLRKEIQKLKAERQQIK